MSTPQYFLKLSPSKALSKLQRKGCYKLIGLGSSSLDLGEGMNDATYGLVIRCGGRDRALRTSATRVSGIANGNLLWRRCHSRRLGVGRGECREGENGELGEHLEERVAKCGASGVGSDC